MPANAFDRGKERKFDALGPDLQTALTSAASELAIAQRKMNEDSEGSSLEA